MPATSVGSAPLTAQTALPGPKKPASSPSASARVHAGRSPCCLDERLRTRQRLALPACATPPILDRTSDPVADGCGSASK